MTSNMIFSQWKLACVHMEVRFEPLSRSLIPYKKYISERNYLEFLLTFMNLENN